MVLLDRIYERRCRVDNHIQAPSLLHGITIGLGWYVPMHPSINEG